MLDFLFPPRCPEFHLTIIPDCDGGEAVVGVDQALDHAGVGKAARIKGHRGDTVIQTSHKYNRGR